MARKTKLTPELQKQIIKLLEQGVSVEDVCSQVGISDRTYYGWRERGVKAANELEADEDAQISLDEIPFLQFFQATTRGLKNAKIKAVGAIYGAIKGFKTTEKSTAVFEETRYHKPQKEGDEPEAFTYRRTTKSNKTILHPPDVRAAIEYLKRRYPDEWSDRLRIDVDPALLKELEALAANSKVELNDLIKALVDELKQRDD
ncbi:MAG: transposase [Chloroflexota bacterium]